MTIRRIVPITVLTLLAMFAPKNGAAHQPVMDMAPRWNGGYGFQVRAERLVRDTRIEDGVVRADLHDLRRETTTTWLEGVYTFRRAHRLTFKMPYVNAFQRAPAQKGVVEEQSGSGLGDLVLGFRNKAYFNKQHSTGNVSLTPSLRLPTGSTSGDISLGQGVLGYGLSLSASVEMFRLYSLFDVFGWRHRKGEDDATKGSLLGFDIDLGVHPYHNFQGNYGLFLMTGINGRWFGKDRLPSDALDSNSGGRTFEVSPTVVLYRNNLMFRAQYSIPLVHDLDGSQLAPSSGFQSGIGIVVPSRSPL